VVSRTLLLVEDDAEQMRLLVDNLRRADGSWEVEWVERLAAAETRAAGGGVDLVLLDLHLPDSHGLDGLVRLSALAPHLPIVMLTGHDDAAVGREALRQGAQDYLVKGAAEGPLLLRVLDYAVERKRTADRLLEAQKLESLGLLAGGVAHDFNNLLGAIIGQTALALGKLPPHSPACANLQKAMNSAERAADLARQMLAYAGRGAFRLNAVALNTVVRDHVRLLEAALPKNVLLRADLAEPLPPVTADAGQIQQVIVNLMLNGADAIGERSGTLTLVTAYQQMSADDLRAWPRPGLPFLGPGLYVRLEVRDSGRGIDPAALPRIFEPFFTTKEAGRGLGLAVVFGIVRAHGGAIRIHSEPSRGTRVEMLFPAAAEPPVAAPPVPTVAETAVSVPATAFGHGLVLVIEDEADLAEATSQMLAAAGFEVLTAPHGQAGLALFDSRPAEVRLVLLDVAMPVMSGEETLRELRARSGQVPVLVCSGFDETDVRRRFAGAGATDFLWKPYNMAELFEAVRRCL
jgi:signal transduction histidine kinase